MLPVFERASQLLGRAENVESGRRILRAVGKEALDEQADWYAMHRYSLRMPNVG